MIDGFAIETGRLATHPADKQSGCMRNVTVTLTLTWPLRRLMLH